MDTAAVQLDRSQQEEDDREPATEKARPDALSRAACPETSQLSSPLFFAGDHFG